MLNVIDGVAAPEERLLIMTSNNPDTLDPVLIRPGRIDKQIYFDHLSKTVASSIFTRVFSVGFNDEYCNELAEEQQRHDIPARAKLLENLRS